MKIQVLGSGCANCKNLYKSVKAIVAKKQIDAIIEYSDDINELLKIGVMSSPVLIVDGKILLAGQIPPTAKIEQMVCEKRVKGDTDDTLENTCCNGRCC